MSELRDRWVHLMKRLRTRDPLHWEMSLKRLLGAYTQPHRHYHTPAHLKHCFEVLDRVYPPSVASPLVEYALWFHDCVYETQGTDNEERSAEEAKATAGVLGFDASLVEQLILATKHDVVPALPSAQIVVDVDLAILGETPEKFDAYEEQIRKEYAWVPEDGYKAGRKKVLQRFLDREWIYSSPAMRNLGYEGRAQENLRRSIARL